MQVLPGTPPFFWESKNSGYRPGTFIVSCCDCYVFKKPGSVHRAAVKDVRNVSTMKRIVMITVLAVLLMSILGATTAMAEGPAKTALSCEPPAVAPGIGYEFQITGTLTDGTSSTPIPGQLITVYASTYEKKWNDEKWTEAGSVSTDTNGHYTVTTSQSIVGNYSYKAVFKGDDSLKKVTSPTISVTVMPVAGSSYTSIHAFSLFNINGLFVCKLACYYSIDNEVTWHESGKSDGIVVGNLRTPELSDLGVPEGAVVRIHAVVIGGPDRTGGERFVYHHYNASDPNTHQYACYWMDGTTFNPKLIYSPSGWLI